MPSPSVVRQFAAACAVVVLTCAPLANVVNVAVAATLPAARTVALLVPDTLPATDAGLRAWLDAAAEEGFRVTRVTDAQFLAQGGLASTQWAGVIVPDSIHTQAGDTLVQALDAYARAGGHLMVVFDAASLTEEGFYAVPRSRLSGTVGVDYVLYDELRDRTAGVGPVGGAVAALRALQVPPGKSMPVGEGAPASIAGVTPLASPEHAISGYGYGPLNYASFVTRGSYDGQVLLSSTQQGLVAGVHPLGAGDVMFVNLPLTYLKLGTDGLPMHGTLGYFMTQVVKAPRLLSVPNGKAGITLNWHLDSQEALKPMQQLELKGVWFDGPFSMHMTAGPDTIAFGDGLGFDLPNNAEARRLMREFKLLGHQLGSHGGWIHDYYGKNVADNNQAEFEPLLVKNRQAVDAVVGKTVEYSAPAGNNPQWTVDWNEKQGVKSLYFLGHTGLGATRFWRDGDLRNPSMWAIPVTPYGALATFEEFNRAGLRADELLTWYKALVDFDIKNRVSRMVYMHPPGAMMYPNVLTGFLSYVRANKWLGKIQWYTFTDLANFMNLRQQVNWATSTVNGRFHLEASHPVSLKTMVWTLPKLAFKKPVAIKGGAVIDDDADNWLIRGGSASSLTVEADTLLN